MPKQILTDWKLCGFHNYVPYHSKSMEVGVPLRGVTDLIPAPVPGSVYEALLNAKIINDPYYELNSMASEWVASRWWIYECSFFWQSDEKDRWELVFEGLDYDAEISFNGNPVAKHKNMFVPCRIDVTSLLKTGKNVIKVLLKSAPDEMGQIGYSSKVFTQKSRFTYKWDFCPRLPGIGICGEVYLQGYKSAKIEDVYFWTEKKDLQIFHVDCTVENFNEQPIDLCCTLYDGETEVFSESVTLKDGKNKYMFNGKVQSPKLWQLNGRGEQPLYTLSVILSDNQGKVLQKVYKLVGFKTLELIKNPKSPQNALPYTFVVKGQAEYIKGVNITPLDMLYGRITNERMKALLDACKEMHVNLIRVWGGGVIESEYFYSLCDRYGILVWQDFILSSSGIDNHPSEEESFEQNLLQTVRFAAVSKRSHVSLAVFCGGNELALGESRKPVDGNYPFIKRCEDAAFELAPHVKFFPSTPSGKSFEKDSNNSQNNHDVHAPWLYLGDPNHYEYCKDFICLFHGEFGCNGMSELISLKQFLSDDNLGVFDMEHNIVWRHHGETWDCLWRDRQIFGENIRTLEDFILTSQFVQAEGLRYLLQTDRYHSPYCGGGMIWVANEPYPNISNTSLIDYYGKKKLAYYVAKCCYANLYAGISYDRLRYKTGDTLMIHPFVIDQLQRENIELSITVQTFPKNECLLHKSKNKKIEKSAKNYEMLSITVPDCEAVLVRLSVQSGKDTAQNFYLFPVIQQDGFCRISALQLFKEFFIAKQHNSD